MGSTIRKANVYTNFHRWYYSIFRVKEFIIFQWQNLMLWQRRKERNGSSPVVPGDTRVKGGFFTPPCYTEITAGLLSSNLMKNKSHMDQVKTIHGQLIKISENVWNLNKQINKIIFCQIGMRIRENDSDRFPMRKINKLQYTKTEIMTSQDV